MSLKHIDDCTLIVPVRIFLSYLTDVLLPVLATVPTLDWPYHQEKDVPKNENVITMPILIYKTEYQLIRINRFFTNAPPQCLIFYILNVKN